VKTRGAAQTTFIKALPGLLAVISLGALASLSLSRAAAGVPTATSETVARFLESGHPALTAYRARRHLEASTRGGAVTAQLDAWTDLAADGAFTFEIIQETGSEVIRERVLRAALLEEQRSRSADQLGASALTPANYDFSVEETSREGDLVKISLSPRRNSRMLIAGVAFVTRDDADLVRVEGMLSKGPSFWTRKVHVTRRYARVDGVRVPVEVQSRADVMLVGHSSFSMTYKYTAINGRPLHAE
jgi:hypothetical protein